MKGDHRADLSKPLPYPGKWRWGYQHYPVYGSAWWRGRAMVFGLGVLAYTLMVGIGAALGFDSKEAAIIATMKFLIGVTGMTFTGATLCSLARTWVKPGRVQQALVVLALLIGLIGTVLFDAWSSKEIEFAFTEHSNQKEQIAAIIEQDKQNTSLMLLNAFVISGLYFWMVSGIAFIRYWREPGQLERYLAKQELSEVKARKHEVEARLSMLQAQIEPHFLFNSLASIKSVIREDPGLAESTINHLVDYLRASTPRFDNEQRVRASSLNEQVSLCRKYLKVMQLRMGERLSFECEVSAQVADCAFPPLVIISLVENAIKHGIEPQTEGGHIHIEAVAEGNDLRIRVSDNGVGLNCNQSSGVSSGLGLANIKGQLEVLFNQRANLELSESKTGGTLAQIYIESFLPKQ